jgi:phosphotriesterase-related protein
MSFVLEEVIPELRNKGVTDDQIQIMMVENARRWFEGSSETGTLSNTEMGGAVTK